MNSLGDEITSLWLNSRKKSETPHDVSYNLTNAPFLFAARINAG